jgi:hypothetical protein
VLRLAEELGEGMRIGETGTSKRNRPKGKERPEELAPVNKLRKKRANKARNGAIVPGERFFN